MMKNIFDKFNAILSAGYTENKDSIDDYLPTAADYDKMKEYLEKKSNPERLVGSIKDKGKLVRRWLVAREMGWGDAEETFHKAIVDRKILSNEDMNRLQSMYQPE